MAHLNISASQIFGRDRQIVVIDHSHVSYPKGVLSLLPPHLQQESTYSGGFVGIHKMLCDIIDSLGQASSRAQGLPSVITSGGKLASSPDQKIYLLIDQNVDLVVGLLKIGRKRLFLCDPRRNDTVDMAMVECQPLCILDFYVVESQQRRGHGRHLCDAMLSNEGVSMGHAAVDSPSIKMIAFLARHYNLAKPFSQRNNFTVFESFFSGNPALASRASSGFRRNLRKSFSSDSIFPGSQKTKSAFAAVNQDYINNIDNIVNFNARQQPPPRNLPPMPVPPYANSRPFEGRERYVQPQSADLIMMKSKQQQGQSSQLTPRAAPVEPFKNDVGEPPLPPRDAAPESYRQLFSPTENGLTKLYNRNNVTNYGIYQQTKMTQGGQQPPVNGHSTQYYPDSMQKPLTTNPSNNGGQQPYYGTGYQRYQREVIASPGNSNRQPPYANQLQQQINANQRYRYQRAPFSRPF